MPAKNRPLRVRGVLVDVSLQDVEDRDASGVALAEVGFVFAREVPLELLLSSRVLSISAASADIWLSAVAAEPAVVLARVVEARSLGWTRHFRTIRLMSPNVMWIPPAGYESVKAGIRRATRAVGIEPGLAKRLWYGEVRRIDAELMDRLRRAADAAARKEASLEYGTLLARTIMGFAAWLTVLIAPWIKDAER